MLHVVAIGLTHHTAPVDVRERIALAPGDYPRTLASIGGRPGVRETVVLSTCNRSELYALAETPEGGRAALEAALLEIAAERGGIELDQVFRAHGPAAARHLFEVAASLDALVVGEPQILGQVKDAYRIATEQKSVGPVLDRLFRQAFEVGKRVRSETEIGAYAVSVSFAAVELAKKIFGPLEGRAAMIIGAGEMGELTVRHLLAAGVSQVWVANRTRATAEEVAQALGGTAIGLDEVERALARVDIVISSTGASEPVLRRPAVERAMKERRGRPLFLIDIAVPRDIEPACGEVYNVFLYNIDDLGRVVADNRERRQLEADKARAIVAEETARFEHWFAGLDTVPTIVALRRRLEAMRAEETARFLKRLDHLSERDRKLVEQYGETLLHKMLHGPMAELRHAGSTDRGTELAHAARVLFRLEGEMAAPSPGEGERSGAPESAARRVADRPNEASA